MVSGSTNTERDYTSLYRKHKHLFTKNEMHSFPKFGFECGDGWYDILEHLIDHIDRYIHHKYKDQEFDFQIVQIKEKFGGLRFYFNGGDAVIFELARYTEELSYRICEYCGSNQNVMRSKGWVITACKHCTENHPALTIRTDRVWYPVTY